MQLENRFTVPVDADRAWNLLLDVERVVPCFPGAAVNGVAGDTIDGSVRIKLGPVLLHYAGTATFVERDPAARRAVLAASGNDRKGGGSAAATISATLRPAGSSATECVIVTDLDVTGRPAQFGRGIMTEVGNRITAQFAANLSAMLDPPAAESPQRVEAADPSPTSGSPARQAGEALDLLQVAAASAVKRLLPVAAAGLALLIVLWVRRGRAAKSGPHHS